MVKLSHDNVGVVVFSFALREKEPNPCNVRLAEATKAIVDGARPWEHYTVVAQWEVARQLNKYGPLHEPARVVELRADGTYLDSEGVWEDAKELFREQGIKDVIPVAQPFLQMAKIKSMIKRDGYNIVPHRMPWIGFDNSPRNTQWWTRGPIRLILYAVQQILFGTKGHGGQQNA